MLIAEAKWLARKIREIGDDSLFPMLNVGSNTHTFRTKTQPWIDKFIFAPARRKKLTVYHADIQKADGVDIVGDLMDKEFQQELAQLQCRSVLCSNLLEHVVDREQIAAALVAAVPSGSFLLVSCPYRFPYHPDPIDTLYRPNVEELAAPFAGTKVVEGEILNCGTWLPYFVRHLIRTPRTVASNVGKRIVGTITPKRTRTSENDAGPDRPPESFAPWLFKRMKATCVVLQKC